MRVNESNLIASITKASFYDFLQEFWGTVINEKPVFNWHVKYLCDELQDMAERVFKGVRKTHDLIINIPPGTTKSTICSQMFPAWVWTRMPHAKFICASYAHQVALKDSMKTRDIVQSELYQTCFPGISLREDENMKGLFANTQTGFRLSAGIGGAVTGYHGHFLLVDDPLNPEEAYSDADLKSANRWMETTLPSRKIDKDVTVMVLVQQRLHQADPSGEMLARSSGPGLKHICLPGEDSYPISPSDLASRYQDGLLDPIRLSRPTLNQLKKDLGEYGYASQVGQSPVPLGGGMFKTDLITLKEEGPSRFVRICRSWDKAGTEGGGAFSAGVKMGVDEKGMFWVLDVKRGQWGSTKREMMIKQTAEADGDEIPILLEIEGGSGGKESGENTVRNLAGFTVITYHPTGDKETRAYPLSSQVGAGNLSCLKRPWTKDFIEEMRFFPASRYKDQIDAASSAFNHIARKKKKIGGMRFKK